MEKLTDSANPIADRKRESDLSFFGEFSTPFGKDVSLW